MVVVTLIGRTAITILLDSVRILLDASLDYTRVLNRIRETVLADRRVAVEVTDSGREMPAAISL